MNAKINLNVLAAVSLFVSKEETRYYLNGVKLEIDADGVTYVATDGHRMFAFRDDLSADEERNTMRGEIIVPLAACKPFKLTARDLRSDSFAGLSGDCTASVHAFTRDEVSSGFKPIDGTFPDWRRVMPGVIETATPGTVCFNWDYVATFEKAAKALDLGSVSMVPNGVNGPAWMRFSGKGQAVGVIMPKRGADYTGQGTPDWVSPARPEADKVAA